MKVLDVSHLANKALGINYNSSNLCRYTAQIGNFINITGTESSSQFDRIICTEMSQKKSDVKHKSINPYVRTLKFGGTKIYKYRSISIQLMETFRMLRIHQRELTLHDSSFQGSNASYKQLMYMLYQDTTLKYPLDNSHPSS